MSESIPQTSPGAAAAAPPIQAQFQYNPVKLLVAVADPIRWAVLRELAGGEALSVLELAGRLRLGANLLSKHLRWLREAGAVVVVPVAGGDGRRSHHLVPESFRRPGAHGKPEIDYGVCVLRFP